MYLHLRAAADGVHQGVGRQRVPFAQALCQCHVEFRDARVAGRRRQRAGVAHGVWVGVTLPFAIAREAQRQHPQGPSELPEWTAVDKPPGMRESVPYLAAHQSHNGGLLANHLRLWCRGECARYCRPRFIEPRGLGIPQGEQGVEQGAVRLQLQAFAQEVLALCLEARVAEAGGQRQAQRRVLRPTREC